MFMWEIILNAVDGFMQCSGFKRNVGHFEKRIKKIVMGRRPGKRKLKVIDNRSTKESWLVLESFILDAMGTTSFVVIGKLVSSLVYPVCMLDLRINCRYSRTQIFNMYDDVGKCFENETRSIC